MCHRDLSNIPLKYLAVYYFMLHCTVLMTGVNSPAGLRSKITIFIGYWFTISGRVFMNS